jgi:hypothetical protein
VIPRGSESRAGTRITLVAIHTAEGATTAAALQRYLDQPGVEASYHKLVDDTEVITYLPDEPASWAMLSGNHRSLQLCFTGFAAWTREQWLAHDSMLRRGAAEVRVWCAVHGIPPVKLTPAQVGADASGICGHWDWTLGKRDGTHSDPGPGFPWDVFLGLIMDRAVGPQRGRDKMIDLPATAEVAPDRPPGTWPQRNRDIGFDAAGGWEGQCAVSFGAQDWHGGGTAAGFLRLASWILPGRTLVPVDPAYTTAGTGKPVEAHAQLGPWVAPPRAIGITLNYAAPGEAYVSVGRSA